MGISIRFGAVQRPSEVAERLPKALIHRNHPGERVHDLRAAADAAWLAATTLNRHVPGLAGVGLAGT